MIKVGICGFGKAVEEFHLPAIKGSKKFRVVSVFDITPQRREKAKKDLGAATYDDYDDFLNSRPDLVIIATPSNSHFEYAISAIESGINLVIEKPMALNTKDCDKIIKDARTKKVLLTVHHNRRLDGDFLAVKKVFNSGVLGKIKFLASRVMNYGPLLEYSVPEFDAAWRYKKGYGGGQLYDFGSHLIDQALNLIGDFPIKIECELKKEAWSEETDTYFKLLLEFRDKIKAEIIASQISKEPLPRWELHGEKGMLLGKTGTEPFKLKLDNKEKTVNIEESQYYRFYDNIYDVITKNRDLLIKPEEARNVVRVIKKAYRVNKAPSSSPA